MTRFQQLLQRQIRASKFSDDSDLDLDLDFSASDSDNDRIEAAGDEHDVSSDAPTSARDKLAEISFGELEKAQAAIGSSLKRKRTQAIRPGAAIRADQDEEDAGAEKADSQQSEDYRDEDEDKDDDGDDDGDSRRDTLERRPSPFHEASERLAGKKQSLTPRSRSSKHAPMEMSSKRPVSRRRTVVEVTARPQARDPRFSSFSSRDNASKAEMNRARQNYAFLDAYRADELAALKRAAGLERAKSKGKNKNVAAPAASATEERLRRKIKRIEDRERAARRVEEERAVVREHRRRERDQVRQGKTPFFLKQADIRRQALAKRYEGASDAKMERIVAKKRKRQAAKERKNMPLGRRGIGDGDGEGGR